MDFLDPKKKRAHQIRLYIGYSLIAVALVAATLVLGFATYGYDIDRKTGGIIQNGLVIVDAHPVGARIYVNGEDKGGTDNRLVLPEDQYTIELRTNSYRNWQHTINLEGSSIEQLVYPFLFPTSLTSKSIQDLAAVPTVASTSPDRHWMVINNLAIAGGFSVVDLSNTKNTVQPISLPTDAYTAVANDNGFEAVEWSTDNTHLLLKHAVPGGTEFILLDRENPSASINLNKTFAGQTFTSVSLRDKKADQFYLFNSANGSLFQADAKTKAVTLQLNGVISYKSYQSNTLLYVVNPTGSNSSVEVHITQDNQDHLLRTLPIAQTYLLDMADFSGHFYMVAGSQADGRTYVYKDPFSDFNRRPGRTPQPQRVLVLPNAQYVSFSAIARFVAVQSGSAFAVYDAETGRQFRYDTKLKVADKLKATWMDGHRLMLVSDGKNTIFDFDGTNLQSLNAALPFVTAFDRDYTAMFTISPNPSDATKTIVQRTELKVNQ